MENIFYKNLKYLREKKNISQQQLADKLDIDRSTISKWENFQMDATLKYALKIADILDVNIEDLLYSNMEFTNDDNYYNNKFISNLKNFKKLEELLKEEQIIDRNTLITEIDYDKIMNFIKNNSNLFFDKKNIYSENIILNDNEEE